MLRISTILLWVSASLWFNSSLWAQTLKQEPNTWIKRSPQKDAPLSPSLGYEGSFGYDPVAKKVIRWAGHNQGGGGEQHPENGRARRRTCARDSRPDSSTTTSSSSHHATEDRTVYLRMLVVAAGLG